MNSKYDTLIKAMKEEIKDLQNLKKTNPELAKKKAKESLIRMGYIDEQGNVLPPYNGQKVHEDDFTRGPGEIDYGDDER